MLHESVEHLTCQEKPSGVCKMQENALAAGAPPRTPPGELTALLRPPSWWGGWLPLPKNSALACPPKLNPGYGPGME